MINTGQIEMIANILKKFFLFSIFIVLVLINNTESAYAYIGPGAGFAFVSSFFILLITFFLALLTFLFWPIRFLVKTFRRKRPLHTKYDVKRVVIVGLDGMDPELASQYMKEGKLPNLSKLSKSGTFQKLQTTLPAISPVAWSTFMTGVDPSRHNIFDFLNRNLKTYLLELSSTKIEKSSRSISIGNYSIPIGKPIVKLLRKGRPFWNILDEYGIFSSIIRVPMTFPPEKLNGTLLSGMCVPDLRGTQGTFTFYTSNNSGSNEKKTGGVHIPVNIEDHKIRTYIPGPEKNSLKQGEEMRIPLEITLNGNTEAEAEAEAEVKVSKNKFRLKPGLYSPWIKLTFKAGPGIKIRGICLFFIKQIHPYFEMYMSPINIDPEKPSLPISYPLSYSIYLSKLQGSYATLGLAEDTWALNERAINEDVFLQQVYKYHHEREEMFFNALDKTRKGLCTCVFDTTDRIQHMFMRFITKDHPANAIGVDQKKYRGTIEDLYKKMDHLVGRTMERIDENDVLFVMSDHGFKPFKRGINLNTWLYKNGYLALKDQKETGNEWFQGVEWGKTRAYTFGMSGIYINEKGRESKGIVSGEEKEELKRELIEKLNGLMDDEKGVVAIRKCYSITDYYDGPYKENGPDIIIGCNEGYRASWGAAVGRVDEKIFEDNKKSWSGDHCMDPPLVPGVFFCNKKISRDNPHIADMGPSVLELFGIEIPSYMTGKPLFSAKAKEEGN
jgi:predicted AlkP superfamily phosphohydrolase/phosphomutase